MSTPLRRAVRPNLDDYRETKSFFHWDDMAKSLTGLPGGHGLNIGYEAVDRHVAAGHGEQVAIRWLPKRGRPTELTYEFLMLRTNRFANALASLGHGPGVRVATLAGRVPDLYVAAIGTLKFRGVFTPLFSAFGPGPIAERIELGAIEVLVTTQRLFERKVAPILDQLPTLRHVLIIGGAGTRPDDDRVHDLNVLLGEVEHDYDIGPTDPEDLALLHFTSGTTGRPKGAMHVHAAALVHLVTGEFVLDLRRGDTYWCTADPGWVTGTSYGITAPLICGVTSIIDEGDFDADRWYSVVESEGVDVWYTAPTAIRMMMRAGEDIAAEHDLSGLRVVASVGEPLNPEAVVWGERVLGMPILDTWWQTETGGIMVANYRTEGVKPGSMGQPVPGIDVAILQRTTDGAVVRDGNGEPTVIAEPNVAGELAIRAGWPSMFRGYLNEPDRYASTFAGDWYCSGDLAKQDADGYVWFVGRGDDVIKSAGHLIGPFEVESALIEHDAVSEAGVIGKPHETMGALVKAFVTLAPGVESTPGLERELIGFARTRLGAAVAPRELEIVDDLPHTRSGKIMRRLLKARELGLPEGDLSTLESEESS